MGDSEYSGDSDHNIGADGNQCMFSEDERRSLFLNHEDAAYDYVTGPEVYSLPSQQSSPPKQSPPRAQRFPISAHQTPPATQQTPPPVIKGTVKSARQISTGQGEGEEMKCFKTEGVNKAQRNREKKKKKKAEGWTQANNIEGHVDFKEVDEVLQYIGEPQPSNDQQPKKKLRKKVKGKGREADRKQTLANGKSSTTASDSENESKVSKVNKNSAMNGDGKHSGEIITHNNSTSTAPPGSQVSYKTRNDDKCTELNSAECEEGFEEVHRRKRRSNKPHAPPPGRSNKPAPKVYNRPAQQDKVNTPVTARPKPAEVDLSIESFPSLESALFPDSRSSCGESKSVSAYTESTRTSLFTESTTDDDRESVSSQVASSKSSWAKVAAKSSFPSRHTAGIEHTEVVDVFLPSEVNSGRATPDLSCSLTSQIEFGTVMANGDPTADQNIQRILSQSHSLNEFKAQTQSKVISRSSSCTYSNLSNGSSRVVHDKHSGSKAVEFVDRHAELKHTDINVMFGFIDEVNSSTISPADKVDSKLISPVNHDDPLGSDKADDIPDAADNQSSLPHAVDVLPRLLSAPYHKSIATYFGSDDTGEFNLNDAINMLTREWNEIKKLKELCGNRKVKFLIELTVI